MQLTFTFDPICSDCGRHLSIVCSRPDHPKYDPIRLVYSFQVVPCECAAKNISVEPIQPTTAVVRNKKLNKGLK